MPSINWLNSPNGSVFLRHTKRLTFKVSKESLILLGPDGYSLVKTGLGKSYTGGDTCQGFIPVGLV